MLEQKLRISRFCATRSRLCYWDLLQLQPRELCLFPCEQRVQANFSFQNISLGPSEQHSFGGAMGFLDRLAGRQPTGPEREPEADKSALSEPTTSGITASELLRDMAPAGVGALGAPPARLYDPYEGMSATIGGKKMVFQLPEAPEFVFQEEAAVRRRGWGENLQFYTGLGYLGGGATGFALGGYRYLQLPAEPSLESAKLKANRLLNMSGSLGRRFACASAVLGLYFATFESLLINRLDGRLPDEAVTATAGFCTAGLYRAGRGPRAAVVSGLVGATAAVGLALLRQRYPSI